MYIFVFNLSQLAFYFSCTFFKFICICDQETADEGQGGGETEGGTASPKGGPVPPSRDGASSPLTVKDLMLGVIEMQLMKNQGNQGGSIQGPQPQNTGPAPTISSILKTDHGFVRDLKSREPQSQSLATLSVVSSQHSVVQPELPKEGLVVVQVNLFSIYFLNYLFSVFIVAAF